MSYIKIVLNLVRLTSLLSNHPCMDAGLAAIDASNPVSSTCTPNYPNQAWAIRYAKNANGKDYHLLISSGDGGAVYYPGGVGLAVYTAPINASLPDTELWAVIQRSDGSYAFESKANPVAVLDIQMGSTASNTAIIASTAKTSNVENQSWLPTNINF